MNVAVENNDPGVDPAKMRLENAAQTERLPAGKIDKDLGLLIGHPRYVIQNEKELHLGGNMAQLRRKPVALGARFP